MQRFNAVVATAGQVPKRQGLVMLNPGELSGYLKDPDGELVAAVAHLSLHSQRGSLAHSGRGRIAFVEVSAHTA